MLVAGFILLTVIIAALLVAGSFTISTSAIADAGSRSAFRTRFVLFLCGWFAYITAMSFSGILTVPGFPPRFPLLLVVPAFAFIGFFFVSGRFKNMIANTPEKWLIYFQSFRILVELLLYKALLEGYVPREATFEGYNYDIVIGLAALVIPAIAFRGGQTNKPVLRLYNIAGLVTLTVVVFVFVTQFYFPGVWHKQPSDAPIVIARFPYAFLPGFLMPAAVFIHIYTLVRMRIDKA